LNEKPELKGLRNFSRLIFLLVFLALVGGGAFLVTWDIPPPVKKVERILPDDRFPR